MATGMQRLMHSHGVNEHAGASNEGPEHALHTCCQAGPGPGPTMARNPPSFESSACVRAAAEVLLGCGLTCCFVCCA